MENLRSPRGLNTGASLESALSSKLNGATGTSRAVLAALTLTLASAQACLLDGGAFSTNNGTTTTETGGGGNGGTTTTTETGGNGGTTVEGGGGTGGTSTTSSEVGGGGTTTTETGGGGMGGTTTTTETGGGGAGGGEPCEPPAPVMEVGPSKLATCAGQTYSLMHENEADIEHIEVIVDGETAPVDAAGDGKWFGIAARTSAGELCLEPIGGVAMPSCYELDVSNVAACSDITSLACHKAVVPNYCGLGAVPLAEGVFSTTVSESQKTVLVCHMPVVQ